MLTLLPSWLKHYVKYAPNNVVSVTLKKMDLMDKEEWKVTKRNIKDFKGSSNRFF